MSKLKILLFVPIIISVFLIFSCDTKKPSTSDSLEQDSLMIKYTAIQDSIDSNWDVMIADDDQKHVLMNRLLLEVSYTNNYDKKRFNELKEAVDQLKVIRYDKKSMANSALIDKYDSATMAVSDQIIAFARNHPRYPDFPMMEELIQNINANNDYVLIQRVHYDNWAKEMNTFSKKNNEKLKSKIEDFESEEIPLFQLPS